MSEKNKKKKFEFNNKRISNLYKNTNNVDTEKKERIWLWLILFPPYGIYKCIKNKSLNKFILISILVLFIFIFILVIDTISYPDRILDSKMKYNLDKISVLGDFRTGETIGMYKHDFIIYNVITSKGEYDIYTKGYKEEDIVGINKISPDRKFIYYSDELPKTIKDVFPEIIRFFNEEDTEEKFGEIEDVLETNFKSQKIKTTKGTYLFNVDYGEIESVFIINENGTHSKLFSKEPVIELPSEINKVLKKRTETLGELAKVISYKLTPTTREYIVLMKNGRYYKIVLDDDKTITIYNGN